MNEWWGWRLENKDHRVTHYLCPKHSSFQFFFWFLYHAETMMKKAKNLRSHLKLLLCTIYSSLYIFSIKLCSLKLSLQLKLFLCLEYTIEYLSKYWIIIFSEGAKAQSRENMGEYSLPQADDVIKQATVNPDYLF